MERDKAAADLMAQLYDRLHRLADGYFVGARRGTLQPTALVHEAFVKLASAERALWRDEEHFCAVAATAMRQVLIDHARRQRRHKRGGGAHERVTLSGLCAESSGSDEVDLLALDDALEELAKIAPRQARLVELRFFAGFTNEQTATALGVSLSTVEQEWRRARAWISRALGPSP